MKKVAIAGAGLAGLAVAWHLLQHPNISVTLFDPKGIGGGASGASTGLLHPFPGRLALRSWQAEEGMKATSELLTKVEEDTGYPVADRRGVLRLALTEQQLHDFPKCVAFGCEWWTREKVQEILPEATPAPALWIPQGMTVYAKPYLDGLWQLCRKEGAEFQQEAFQGSERFDRVVLAMGFETPAHLPHSLDIPLKITRGRALLCRSDCQLPFALLSQGHLTSSERPNEWQLGSTYEDPKTLQDPAQALALKKKIAHFYPPAQELEVLQIRVGCRISRQQGYRPIVSQINPKTWAFFGLGSRGLLYHSWLARTLADSLFFSMFSP